MWNGVFIYVYTLLSITEIWNGMHVYIIVCTQEMLPECLFSLYSIALKCVMEFHMYKNVNTTVLCM